MRPSEWRGGSYATLSRAAHQQQRLFRLVTSLILGLGVLVTTLVVVQVVLQSEGRLADDDPLAVLLHYAIVIVPITVAALVAAAARLRPGSRWVQLRGSAEYGRDERLPLPRSRGPIRPETDADRLRERWKLGRGGRLRDDRFDADGRQPVGARGPP